MRRRRPQPHVKATTPDGWQRGATIGGLVSVLLVAVGLYLTNDFNRDQVRLQQGSARQQQESALRQQDLALQQQDLALKGQRAERFTKAIEQLGQEGGSRLDIRLGGIYALETLMRDSPSDENAIIEVLCAFIRTHAPLPATVPENVPNSPIDVRAALKVLSRRPDPDGHTYLDFSNTLLGLKGMDLRNAFLKGASLNKADLTGADLREAHLTDGHLQGAAMRGADLTGADLTGVDLTAGDLRDAVLLGAALFQADLVGADLRAAYLRGANLDAANLAGADLTGADLYAADLAGADARSATLADVRVDCVEMDNTTNLPPGIVRPPLDALKSPRCHEGLLG